MIKNNDHWLVFSYNPDEIMPIICGFGHELKEKNVVKLEKNKKIKI